MILAEPEIHLGRQVLVPDLAGWRRTRLPRLPAIAYIAVATHAGDAVVRIEPFEDIEIEIGALWGDAEDEEAESPTSGESL
jgi:hypothetical protein